MSPNGDAMTDNERKRQDILRTLADAISDFLYYDRKEDDALPVGAIEQAIKDQIISIDELAEIFEQKLLRSLTP